MFKQIMYTIFLATIAVAGVTLATQYVRADLEKYRLESECVSKHIKQGYRRSQIETYNGTCSIKTTLSPN